MTYTHCYRIFIDPDLKIQAFDYSVSKKDQDSSRIRLNLELESQRTNTNHRKPSQTKPYRNRQYTKTI